MKTIKSSVNPRWIIRILLSKNRMPYTIQTPSAVRLKKEILDRVSQKVDADGKGITTWQCVEIAAGERVLVHTTDQWAEKGCIVLKQEYGRKELQVKFHYWDSCEDRCNDDM